MCGAKKAGLVGLMGEIERGGGVQERKGKKREIRDGLGEAARRIDKSMAKEIDREKEQENEKNDAHSLSANCSG